MLRMSSEWYKDIKMLHAEKDNKRLRYGTMPKQN